MCSAPVFYSCGSLNAVALNSTRARYARWKERKRMFAWVKDSDPDTIVPVDFPYTSDRPCEICGGYAYEYYYPAQLGKSILHLCDYCARTLMYGADRTLLPPRRRHG